MRANLVMKQNVKHYIRERGLSQKGLAMYCYKKESWASKILTVEKRSFPPRYYDRIADYLGVSLYELFRPGLSHLTERRSGTDRRMMKERRTAPGQRAMLRVSDELETHRPRKGASVVVASSSREIAVKRLTAEYERKITALLQAPADTGHEDPAPRTKIAPPRKSHRSAS